MNSRNSLRLSWILGFIFIIYPEGLSGSYCITRYVGQCQLKVSCDPDSTFIWNYVDVDKTVSGISCNGYSDIHSTLYYGWGNTRDYIKFKVTINLHDVSTMHEIEIPTIEGLIKSQIHELNICCSKIESNPVFKEMTIIKTIIISDNYLTVAKLYNKYPLNSLQEYDCSRNRISSFGTDPGFYPFVGLTHLNVSYNLLKAVPDETFTHLTNLQSLDLSFNNIESLNVMSFKGLTQLQKLNLTSNRINDCAFLLQKLDNLKELYLDRNQIKYLRNAEFEHLKKLKILIMNSNNIISIDNNVFKSMSLLETLNLKNNSLNKINKDSFEGVEKLQSVDLSFNKIEVLYGNLFKGNNISSFSIKGNKIKGRIGKGVFEGVFMESKLDLSNQLITEIGDYAFYMLKELISLNISHNQIQNLSKFSFKTLSKLSDLDLSFNRIVDIDFDKQDLLRLKTLNLRNNLIHQLGPGVFLGLSDLQELYLSGNNILLSSMAQTIFQPLQLLITIELSHNPLGDIEANYFSGLHTLENVDLSYTFLNVIKNGAFFYMESLKYLNISYSNLTKLENDIFGNDTSMAILDLSHNKINKLGNILKKLINLRELYLNNNIITEITKSDFDGLSKISKLTLSENLIGDIELHSFETLSELKNLNLSFNPNLMFKGSLVQNNTKLETLFLSGTGNQTKCTDMEIVPLLELELSSSNISDLRFVEFSRLQNLNTLDLSRNIIKAIEINTFDDLINLKLLDLSFNEINFIQPGSFKGNTHLNTLNISHNQITTITYGTFRGMMHIFTIDLSFNNLKTLKSDQFFEIPNINTLIVDANKLEKIEMDHLLGLKLLSLGKNLLKCDDLSKMISVSNKNEQNLTITSISIDFHSANVHGISCYHESGSEITDFSDVYEYNGNSSAVVALLSDIRNMMHSIKNSAIVNLNRSKADDKLYQFKKDSLQDSNKIANLIENTNNMTKTLSNILKLMTVPAQTSSKSVTDSKITSNYNLTDNNINEHELKHSLLNNKVVDLEKKMAALVSRFENKTKFQNETDMKSDNFIVESGKSGPGSGHTTLTDVCVVSILVILVAILLYKLLEFGVTKLCRKSQRTASIREMTENIDTSNF